MTTVRKILDEKPDAKVYTVGSNENVLDALKVMQEGNTGAVLVTENDRIIGIFTERDYAREGEIKGRCAKDTPVSDVMTRELVSIIPETTVQQCMELMAKYRIRHLPVVENDRIVAVVSLRRVIEAVISEKSSTILDLENYILGTGYGR
jgi:CBS domain-containing protein